MARANARAAEARVGGDPGKLTLNGDLSDLGSGSTRVVHARLSNYTPL